MELVLAIPLLAAGLWLSARAIAGVRVSLSFNDPGRNTCFLKQK